MSRVIKAVVEAGLVDSAVLSQLNRWGVPIEAIPSKTLKSLDEVVSHVREAIESEDMISIEETDLDLLQSFLDDSKRSKGKLIIKDEDKSRTLSVQFVRTMMGSVAIPWVDKDSPDLLINEGTHLKYEDGDQRATVSFVDYRMVYFGSKRAFVVCEVQK